MTRDACLRGMQETWKHALELELKGVQVVHKVSVDAQDSESNSTIKIEKTPYHSLKSSDMEFFLPFQ